MCIRALKRITESGDGDSVQLLKSLDTLKILLIASSKKLDTYSLKVTFELFVVPGLKSNNATLMQCAFECLGLQMLMDLEFCREKIEYVFGAFESGEFDLVSLKILFDIVSFYGLTVFGVSIYFLF